VGQSVCHLLHQSIACCDPFGEHVIATRSSHDCAIEIRQVLAHVAEVVVPAKPVFNLVSCLWEMQPRETRAKGEPFLDSHDSHGGHGGAVPQKDAVSSEPQDEVLSGSFTQGNAAACRSACTRWHNLFHTRQSGRGV